MTERPNGLTYAQAGVDIDAGNALVDAIKPLAKATRRPGAEASLGGFGALFDLKAAGYDDPLLVTTTDGVGTKLKIAIETGLHDTVGIDLVAMCVNDLLAQGAEPLMFLDYLATSKLDVAVATRVIAGIAEGCKLAGAALVGGETAEMPGMYAGADYDLAGFSVGAVDRNRVLPRMDDQGAGDLLIGLASSGPHSNGYSLIRKIIERSKPDLAMDIGGIPLADAIMSPTHIYVKPLLSLIQSLGGQGVKGMAHITGGGLTENIPRVLPDNLTAIIDQSTWPQPALFQWLQREGNIAAAEMHRVFNCGIGMVVITAEADANSAMQLLTAAGEKVFSIGRIETRGTDQAPTVVI